VVPIELLRVPTPEGLTDQLGDTETDPPAEDPKALSVKVDDRKTLAAGGVIPKVKVDAVRRSFLLQPGKTSPKRIIDEKRERRFI